MPQLSGPEFAEFLSTMSPELPLIFMTGYSNSPITTESGERRITNRRVIMKPFRPNVLSTVREVLDATEPRGRATMTGRCGSAEPTGGGNQGCRSAYTLRETVPGCDGNLHFGLIGTDGKTSDNRA